MGFTNAIIFLRVKNWPSQCSNSLLSARLGTVDCPAPIPTYKTDLWLLKTHLRNHCTEKSKRARSMTHCVCGCIHAHMYVRPPSRTCFYRAPTFTRTLSSLTWVLSRFLLLSISRASPIFRGTWRHIRQGSETDCNSSVHFSAASGEPVSIRWPQLSCGEARRVPAQVSFTILLTGALGAPGPDVWTWGARGPRKKEASKPEFLRLKRRGGSPLRMEETEGFYI